MVMICPYCDMEINEKQMEAEDGCCPECGALITAGNVLSEDDDFYADDEFSGEDEFSDDAYENDSLDGADPDFDLDDEIAEEPATKKRRRR